MQKIVGHNNKAVAFALTEVPSTSLRAGSSQRSEVGKKAERKAVRYSQNPSFSRHSLCLRQAQTDKENESVSQFADVYENYSELVYNCILQIVCCKESSRDLMHDVFVRLLEDEGCLKEVSNVGGFLFMTARNIAIDHLRKQKRMHAILKEYSIQAKHFYFDDGIVKKEFSQRLYDSVEALPAQQRMVYRMIREEGRRRDEVASELKIAENTVKEQMRKALGRLRVEIEHG